MQPPALAAKCLQTTYGVAFSQHHSSSISSPRKWLAKLGWLWLLLADEEMVRLKPGVAAVGWLLNLT